MLLSAPLVNPHVSVTGIISRILHLKDYGLQLSQLLYTFALTNTRRVARFYGNSSLILNDVNKGDMESFESKATAKKHA